MPKYFSNARESIEEIFDREGDRLAREGFGEPKFSAKPENYGRKIVEVAVATEADQVPQHSLGVERMLAEIDNPWS